jgi:Protein of unknown function (DUF2723)
MATSVDLVIPRPRSAPAREPVEGPLGPRLAEPVALALVVLPVAAVHVAGWSRHPSDVDPINFTMALEKWNVSIGAPHPPGYPIYVAAAKAVSGLLPGVAAYQSVNLMLLVGTAIVLYLILRAHDRLAGLAAAGLMATHPLAWSASVTADCYALDAFGSVAVLAAALKTRQLRPVNAFWVLFSVYLGCALARPVSALMLLPLGTLAGGYVRSRFDGRRIVQATVAGCAAIAIGYVTTALLAGGFAAYNLVSDQVMGSVLRESSVFAGAPGASHLKMLLKMLTWFAVLAVPYGLLFVAGHRRLRLPGDRNEALYLSAAWLLPTLGFYAAIYYLKPTHHLIDLPLLVMAGGLGAAGLGRKLGARLAFLPASLLMLLQLAFFWLGPTSLPQPLARLTHAHLVEVDTAWDALQRALAQERLSQTLFLYRDHPQLPFRALRLMIADRPQGLVDKEGRRVSLYDAHQGRLMAASESIAPDVRRIVVIDAKGPRAMLFGHSLANDSDRTLASVLAAAQAQRGLPL